MNWLNVGYILSSRISFVLLYIILVIFKFSYSETNSFDHISLKKQPSNKLQKKTRAGGSTLLLSCYS